MTLTELLQHARRRRDQRQRRPRPGVGRVPARQQHQPCGGAGRRRARQLGHHRHQRVRAHAAGADRAHRGRCAARQSSLYGADAIGGVIQIFTRQGGSTRPRPRRRRHVAHARGIGRHRPRVRRDAACRCRPGYRESRALLGHQRQANRVLVQPRRRPLPQRQRRPATCSTRMGRRPQLALRATGTARRRRTSTPARAATTSTASACRRLALESSDRFSGRLAQPAAHGARQPTTCDRAARSPSRFDTDQDQLTWQNDIDGSERARSSRASNGGARSVDERHRLHADARAASRRCSAATRASSAPQLRRPRCATTTTRSSAAAPPAASAYG